MQQPIYKFFQGQEIIVELNRSKSHVVGILNDIVSDGTPIKLIVTKQYSQYKQRWIYSTYREYEASTMMYALGREIYQDKSPRSALLILHKYKVDRVVDFDKDGHLYEITDKSQIKITEFK